MTRVWPATRRAFRAPTFWVQLICLVLIVALWDTPLLLPLKWLTVLFHELSHAIAGVLTGGRVISLNVTAQEGGIALIAGGNRTLILLAGYPGSLCWGLAAIKLADRDRWVAPCLYLLGAALTASTLAYTRPILGFGFLFSLTVAAALPALAHYATAPARDFTLRFIGLASVVYVLVDIQQDIFYARGEISDAMLLTRHTGLSGIFWGLFWYILSLALIIRHVIRPAAATP